MCEWQSMMPGETKRPVASMTSAPDGTVTFRPTSAIRPARMRTVPSAMTPLVTVRIVAWVMAMTGSPAGGVRAASPAGDATARISRRAASRGLDRRRNMNRRLLTGTGPAIRGSVPDVLWVDPWGGQRVRVYNHDPLSPNVWRT
jgi:hypothetical protein